MCVGEGFRRRRRRWRTVLLLLVGITSAPRIEGVDDEGLSAVSPGKGACARASGTLTYIACMTGAGGLPKGDHR